MVAAQEAAVEPSGLKSVRMVRTATPPVVDGVLDDSVWALAAVIDDFKQSQPIEGDEPTERTEIYLLYDDDALYIGGRFWDSEPDLIANFFQHLPEALRPGPPVTSPASGPTTCPPRRVEPSSSSRRTTA